MKRFNLSEIMRNAHRTYKHVGKKQGKTFGDVLKSTWKLAKMSVAMQESAAKRQAEAARQAEEVKNRKPAERSSYDSFNLNWADCYNSNSRGYMGSQYCGD